MESQGDMVELLRPLVESNRERRQGPVRFRPETWRPWLDRREAGDLLRLGAEDRSSPSERLISRDDLATLRQAIGDDTGALRDLFIAVMIWGSGTTNGRGPRYTHAALSDDRLLDVLQRTRTEVRAGDLRTAYEKFTVRGVRRSFFTKWFAAVDDRDATCERALILDNRVFRSLNELGWSSIEAAGSRRRSIRYVSYVTCMHNWAGSLGVTAAWLEWLLFDLDGYVHVP